MQVLVEGCVTTVEEAVRCVAAGAARLELCSNLEVGGLTPSPDLVADVCGAVRVPVFTMVRPRPGDYVHGPSECARMVADIGVMRSAGAAGIVAGVLLPDGRVDAEATRRLVRAAKPLPVTFHRAFDSAPDPYEALEALVETGVTRILTSGGPGAAVDGADVLAGLLGRAAGRLVIMPGGRVRAGSVIDLVRRTGAVEVHARAAAVPEIVRVLADR